MLPVDSIVPRAYPLAKQCDPAWAADVIHIKTVCAVGCLMSSTAMALRQHGINIDGKIATPGTLNAWLRSNKGYLQGTDDFDEVAIQELGTPSQVRWSNHSTAVCTGQMTSAGAA